MPRVKIYPLQVTFDKEVHYCLRLADDATKFRESRSGTYRPIRKLTAYSIVELSFLKFYISWENFLEQTFVRYMCGGANSSGYSPVRYVQPRTIKHAFNMIRQERRYIDWTASDVVINRALLYFRDGEPYASAIGSLPELEEMRKVRNRIAHRSEYSERAFVVLSTTKARTLSERHDPWKIPCIHNPKHKPQNGFSRLRGSYSGCKQVDSSLIAGYLSALAWLRRFARTHAVHVKFVARDANSGAPVI